MGSYMIGVRWMLSRIFGIVAGNVLALIVANVSLPPVVMPSATTPQQIATVETIRWGLYVLFAILGSGAWAFARPPGLKPYFDAAVRFPTMRMIFVGFAWGMFALMVGQWRGWGQGMTTAAIFVTSVMWEFLMLTVVWLGKRMSSNPVQFWNDMKAGKLQREQMTQSEQDVLSETLNKRKDEEVH